MFHNYILYNYNPIPTPGPNGNFNKNQTISNTDHPTNNAIEYGIIVDIIVPAPVSSSYF